MRALHPASRVRLVNIDHKLLDEMDDFAIQNKRLRYGGHSAFVFE
jgi:hypothetical protein